MTSTLIPVRFGQIAIDFCCNWSEEETRLVSYLKSLKELWSSGKVRDKLRLIFISAETSSETAEHLRFLPENLRPLVELSQRAWAKAANYDAVSEPGESSSLLRDWRLLLSKLEVIVPHLNLYHFKGVPENHYFCFLPRRVEFGNNSKRILETMYLLGGHWHSLRGGIACLHASAVVKGGGGFVFLGPSGAGKSTAALFGLEAGGQIIDDDMVCIAGEEDNSYSVLSPRVWGRQVGKHPMARFVDVGPGVPLGGIFVLIKAEENRLVPLSEMAAAYALTRQALGLDGTNQLRMPENMMRRIFENCCAIAERVPAYQLYFRKSPDFWKLIDDTLGT
jgi:hypothetical protein